MAWISWKTWSICHKDYPTGIVGVFGTKSECHDYLNLKREQQLFNYGCVNDDVSWWDDDNFIIDYSLTLARSTIHENFSKLPLSDWNHD